MDNDIKKREAILRMKLLGIHEPTIERFSKDGIISESMHPVGMLYWVSDSQLLRIRSIEKEKNILIYHLIHSTHPFGEVENYFFVSDYPDEWVMDRIAIENKEPSVYAFNLTKPDWSAFGSIGIEKTDTGGLMRVW